MQKGIAGQKPDDRFTAGFFEFLSSYLKVTFTTDLILLMNYPL